MYAQFLLCILFLNNVSIYVAYIYMYILKEVCSGSTNQCKAKITEPRNMKINWRKIKCLMSQMPTKNIFSKIPLLKQYKRGNNFSKIH